MNNQIKYLSSRIVAVILALLIIASVLPVSMLTVLATTDEEAGVTVAVLDEDNVPLENAVVEFIIKKEDGSEFNSGTANTNAEGIAQVLAKSDYADGLTLTATVSLDDYQTDNTTIEDKAIEADNQSFSVTLKSAIISGVKITPISTAYDGKEHNAALVEGVLPTDTVKYKLDDNDWQEEMPVIKEPNLYSLTVSVERDGYVTFIKTVNPEITLNNIELEVAEYSGRYDEESHPAITINKGLQEGDVVTFSLNNGPEQDAVPEITNAGKYTVAVHIERYGYSNYDQVFTNIEISAINIDGLTAKAYSGVYDGGEHEAVIVEGMLETDVVEYQFDGGDWTTAVPKIKNAGSYPINVRVTRNSNYNVTDVDVIPANAFIDKAEQSLSFDNYPEESSIDEVKGLVNNDKTYNFSATDAGKLADGKITYSLELDSDDAGIASIDNDGKLTVKDAGKIVVKATLSGNDNYYDKVITHTLNVTAATQNAGDFVKFDKNSVSYTLGADNGIASKLTASNKYDRDNGTITYSIDKNNIGLLCDSASGKIKVEDYAALAKAIQSSESGSLEITVTANKSATDKYAADIDTYKLTISFAKAPVEPFTLKGTTGENGWYKSSVTVTAAEGYTISKSADSGFGESVNFDNQGSEEVDRYVYLKSTDAGSISRNKVAIKIDTSLPSDISIQYSEPVAEKILSSILWFYNPAVDVTFSAKDDISGITKFKWECNGEVSDSGEIPAEDIKYNEEKQEYYATVKLPKDEAEELKRLELNGNITVTAYDEAGWGTAKTDEEHTIIIDTVTPKISVSYPKADRYVDANLKDAADFGSATQAFYDSDVTAKITINEPNFFEGQKYKENADSEETGVVHEVGILVEKTDNNGNVSYVEYLPDGSKSLYDVEYKDRYATKFIEWSHNGDEHSIEIEYSDEADYELTVEYTDFSKNNAAITADDKQNEETQSYTSKLITVDKTAPQVNFDFTHNGDSQTAKVTVKEHNFRASDITVTATAEDGNIAKDINGQAVEATDIQDYLRNCKWTSDGDRSTNHYFRNMTIENNKCGKEGGGVFADAWGCNTADIKLFGWNKIRYNTDVCGAASNAKMIKDTCRTVFKIMGDFDTYNSDIRGTTNSDGSCMVFLNTSSDYVNYYSYGMQSGAFRADNGRLERSGSGVYWYK